MRMRWLVTVRRERDGMKWLAPDGDVVARLAPHGVQRALRRNPGGPAMTNSGIDLGRRMSQICILKQDGEFIERRVRTERDRFAAAFKAHPGARILIEAGTESEWVARCRSEERRVGKGGRSRGGRERDERTQ